MRHWIEKFTPKTPMGQKTLMLAVVIAVGVGAFFWGRRQPVGANPPSNLPNDPRISQVRDKRIVAYLYDNQIVSREELGEYLIARFGADRLEFMVNRKIVEIECAKYKIYATDEEVELRFRQDLSSFGKLPLTEQDFVNNVLRRFNKTLYEWKEDVIRPKIMMEKLVKSQIQVGEQDVRDGFEARFGPKVHCRMIVLQKDSYAVQQVWQDVRKGPPEFMKAAATQFVPNLAESKGSVPPIHKHFGDKLLEETAFRLRENEISEPLKMQDGTWVILMCEKHIPANAAVKYEQVWLQVHKEVQDLKIAQKMPEVFAKLRERANPKLMLDNAVLHVTRLEAPTESGGATLRAFESVPRPMQEPTNVQTPIVTPVTAPPGLGPIDLPKMPPPPLKLEEMKGLVLPPLSPPAPAKK